MTSPERPWAVRASPAAGYRDLWGRIEELFHEALALPSGEWREFLTASCRDDEELWREVESLLAALEGPEALGGAGASEQVPASGAVPAPRPERIGPYRLLDVLGEGGMGTVYLAEQGGPLPRRVALKLMRWGGGDALRRFELEREALARMSHPAVAQVFDAGATEHGQPYVVLEHIPGLPVTEYCDSRRLGLRRRLELLAAVCDGVRHAHEKGVIHRDLKPSNILVSDAAGGPLPKIIDFGIAKALEPWNGGVATVSRQLVGSPGYTSPEAMMGGGRAVDTRSDVYSLGVVLCELLVGVRPFEGRCRWAVEASRPSQRLRAMPAEERREIARRRRLDEGKLVRQLRGELDWIVLRAVAAEPAERYGSAAELAADVGRWLAGRPVEARPPSFTYRARKAARRHLAACAAALLIAATVVGFSIRTRILYGRAEAARVQAEELVGFMLDDLSAALEPMERLDLLESVSRESLAYFESSAAGGLAKAGRRPAAALRQIGQVLATRGDLDAATKAYDRALELDSERFAERPDDPSRRLDLASDLELQGQVHDARGELLAAASRLGEAETHLRRIVADFPDNASARLALADLLSSHIASLRRERDDVEGARSSYAEALAILEDLDRTHPDDPETRHALGDAHYGIGLLRLYAFDDARGAIREFEAALAVFRDLADRQPEAATWRYRLAVLNGQGLATAYANLGSLTEAKQANREALALLDVLVREEPGNGRWAHALGWELNRQGLLAHLGGDLDEAARAYRQSAEVQEALVARTTGAHSVWVDGLACAYQDLADVLSEAGELEEALAVAEAALATRRKMVGDEGESLFLAASHASGAVAVADLRVRLGDAAGALEPLDEAGGIIERLTAAGVEDSSVRADLAESSLRRGDLLESLGRGAAARGAFETCVHLLQAPDVAPSDGARVSEVLDQARARLDAIGGVRPSAAAVHADRSR